ncbi:MAG: hypothetical protein ACK5Q5_21965, partial [Planctomycetaceae bacterium]
EYGYNFNHLDTALFLKEAAGERVASDKQIQIPNAPAYLVPRSDAGELWVKAAFPLRIYKLYHAQHDNSERSAGANGVRCVTISRANMGGTFYLTDDRTLAPCSPLQAMHVENRGGEVYHSEGMISEIMFCDVITDFDKEILTQLPFNNFDKKAENAKKVFVDVVVDHIRFGEPYQDSWGYYRRTALIQNDWDSDCLLNWNVTGALTGMTPDYFRPQTSSPPQEASAFLVSAILRSADGRVIAKYVRPTR